MQQTIVFERIVIFEYNLSVFYHLTLFDIACTLSVPSIEMIPTCICTGEISPTVSSLNSYDSFLKVN